MVILGIKYANIVFEKGLSVEGGSIVRKQFLVAE